MKGFYDNISPYGLRKNKANSKHALSPFGYAQDKLRRMGQLVLEIEEMFEKVIEAHETNDTAVAKESHLSIQGIVNIRD